MYCRFISDNGKKYVWAGLDREPTIAVFDIDTGAVVESIDTCEGQHRLKYHSLRDEVWVRCNDVVANSTLPTNVDMISASGLVRDIHTSLLTKDNARTQTLPSSWGCIIIHETLGGVGCLSLTTISPAFSNSTSTLKPQLISLRSVIPMLHTKLSSRPSTHIFS